MTEKPATVRSLREELLGTVIGFRALIFERIEQTEFRDRADDLLYHLYIQTLVQAYMADRFLAALESHAPDAVAAIVEDVAEALEDGGEPGEYAHDTAVVLGMDPSNWADETVTWARGMNYPKQAEAGRG